MLSSVAQNRFQQYVNNEGGHDKLLYGGRKQSSHLDVSLTFQNQTCEYKCSLEPTAGSLSFSNERIFPGFDTNPDAPYYNFEKFHNGDIKIVSGALHWTGNNSESLLSNIHHGLFASYILSDMQRWKVFHFQDMSATAPVRNKSDIHDNRYLRSDAGNLAPILRFLQEHHPYNYGSIVHTAQMVEPSFGDFVFRNDDSLSSTMELEWIHKSGDPDMVLGARQLSDGILRFICLSTLFNQPEFLQPNIILLDEPELGLTPLALTLLSEMIDHTTDFHQVMISTQSPELISHFEPEDIVVVSLRNNESFYERVNPLSIDLLLEADTLGDLWKMNVIGSKPHPW